MHIESVRAFYLNHYEELKKEQEDIASILILTRDIEQMEKRQQERIAEAERHVRLWQLKLKELQEAHTKDRITERSKLQGLIVDAFQASVYNRDLRVAYEAIDTNHSSEDSSRANKRQRLNDDEGIKAIEQRPADDEDIMEERRHKRRR